MEAHLQGLQGKPILNLVCKTTKYRGTTPLSGREVHEVFSGARYDAPTFASFMLNWGILNLIQGSI
jgi:hypothetical protein